MRQLRASEGRARASDAGSQQAVEVMAEAIYLVRRSATNEEKKNRNSLWRYAFDDCGNTWTWCKRCAWRFDRLDAHQLAHECGDEHDIVRLKLKAKAR
jgi:hypothetical protein